MKSITYIRILTVLALVLAGLAVQNVHSLVPGSTWDDVDEFVYHRLVPLVPEREQEPTRITIIEIDTPTIAEYGWPLRREAIQAFLAHLRVAGSPWVASLIHLRDTTQGGFSAEVRAELKLANANLAHSIADYGKWIGSGLALRSGEELSTEQEEQLLPRTMLSKLQDPMTSLPYFPFVMLEDDLFIAAQSVFGLDTGFTFDDDQPCVPMYADTVGEPGSYTFPTALLWAVHRLNPERNRLGNGLMLSPNHQHTAGRPFASMECLPSPDVTTTAFLHQRKIRTLSFAEFIENPEVPDLAGGLVVLGSPAGWRFRGPAADRDEDRTLAEHLLFARFADRIDRDKTIGRSLHAIGDDIAYGELFFIILCIALVYRTGPIRAFWGAAALLVTLLGTTLVHMSAGHLETHPRLMTFATVMLLLMVGVWFFTRLMAAGMAIRFRDHIRIGFTSADDLARIVDIATAACRQALPDGRLKATHCHQLMLLSSLSAEELAQRTDIKLLGDTPIARCQRLPGRRGYYILIGGKHVKGNLQITYHGNAWTNAAARRVVHSLAREIVDPWHRIEFTTLKRLSDARTLKFQADVELGRTVQQLTLPEERAWQTKSGNVSIDFEPYGAMSGDWYQSFQRPDGSLTVLAIGDVMGKGPSAALATTVIAAEWKRATEFWLTAEPDIDKFLQALHSTVFHLFRGKQNTTLSLVVINDRGLTCYRCGSPNWILFQGESSRYVARGPTSLIGHSSRYDKPRQETIAVDQPMSLWAFSDGVFETSLEWANARRHFGKLKPKAIRLETLANESLVSKAQDDRTFLCFHYS